MSGPPQTVLVPPPPCSRRVPRSLPSTNGLLDWDCAAAIDVDALADALSYIRRHAAFPVSPAVRVLTRDP